jgi:hypothetical protein
MPVGKTVIGHGENRDRKEAMTHHSLEQDFPGKRLTRIVNRTVQNPLSFNELVVYSCLVERATHGKGANQRQIHRATGLHASTAIPSALQTLQRLGLVVKTGQYWRALEPAGEATGWFKNRKDSGEQAWHRRFSYWWMALRSKKSPLTVKQNAVYFKLLNVSGSARWRCQEGLSKLLGVDRKTVRTALAKLKSSGLVSKSLWPGEPTADQLAWFRDKPKKRPFKLSALIDLSGFGPEGETTCTLLDGFVPMMVDAGYTESQMRDFFSFALDLGDRNFQVFYTFVTGFKKVFKQVESAHHVNRAQGKFQKAKNSLGLLKSEAKKVISRLRQRMKR